MKSVAFKFSDGTMGKPHPLNWRTQQMPNGFTGVSIDGDLQMVVPEGKTATGIWLMAHNEPVLEISSQLQASMPLVSGDTVSFVKVAPKPKEPMEEAKTSSLVCMLLLYSKLTDEERNMKPDEVIDHIFNKIEEHQKALRLIATMDDQKAADIAKRALIRTGASKQ